MQNSSPFSSIQKIRPRAGSGGTTRRVADKEHIHEQLYSVYRKMRRINNDWANYMFLILKVEFRNDIFQESYYLHS